MLEEIVVAIDLGDIRKRYTGKMECQCGIRDGSYPRIAEIYLTRWKCDESFR